MPRRDCLSVPATGPCKSAKAGDLEALPDGTAHRRSDA